MGLDQSFTVLPLGVVVDSKVLGFWDIVGAWMTRELETATPAELEDFRATNPDAPKDLALIGRYAGEDFAYWRKFHALDHEVQRHMELLGLTYDRDNGGFVLTELEIQALRAWVREEIAVWDCVDYPVGDDWLCFEEHLDRALELIQQGHVVYYSWCR